MLINKQITELSLILWKVDPSSDADDLKFFGVTDRILSLDRPGGPILLLIGGEGEANVAWMGAGSWLGEYKSNPSSHWWRRRGKRCLDGSWFLVR